MDRTGLAARYIMFERAAVECAEIWQLHFQTLRSREVCSDARNREVGRPDQWCLEFTLYRYYELR